MPDKNSAPSLPKSSATTLYSNVAKGDQSVTFEEVAQVGAYRARVHVKLDTSYKNQSTATVYVWSLASLSWNSVASLHWSHIMCRGAATHEAFQADRDELLRRFELVVLP